MGTLQELNELRKRAKALGIVKPHTMKKPELEKAIREAEAHSFDASDAPEVPVHPYGDSFTGMLCGTMVTRFDSERRPYGEPCGLPSGDPVHVGSEPLDPWDRDELLSGGEADEDVEAVIERHTHPEPLPAPAHPLDRQRGPKTPVGRGRVSVITVARTPIKPGQRGR